MANALLLIVAVLPTCAYPTASSRILFERPDVTIFVTSDVRAHLDAAGHFTLPRAAATDHGVISPERAVELATAYLRIFAGNNAVLAVPPGLSAVSLRKAIEHTHGRAIDWKSVRPVEWPPYYMASSIQSLSDSVPGYLRRHLGPRCHVLFRTDDAIFADVAVSSYATHVSADLQAAPGTPLGGEFQTGGIPAAAQNAVPLLPEAAVRHVAQMTGALIAALPELVGPSPLFQSIYARWRLTLDRAVTVRRTDTDELVSTRTLFVGLGPGHNAKLAWYIGAAKQPESETWPFASLNGEQDSVVIRYDPRSPAEVIPWSLVEYGDAQVPNRPR